MVVARVLLAGQLASAAAGAIAWEAPAPDCPPVAEVEAAVQRLAGRMPEPHEIEARAEVTRAGDRWRLQLTTTIAGTVQERSLEADTCDALARATAIIVAVAIDPIGAAHEVRSAERIEAPAATETPPAIESAIEPAPVPVAPPEQPTRRRAPLHVQLGIGGGVAIGAVPGVTGGPVAAAGLTVGRFRAELRGAWWAPRVATADGVSARIQLGTVGLVACGEPGLPRATFPICAGIETGAMRASGGQDVPGARVRHLGWLAAVLVAGVRGWVRPRVGLRADLELGIPLVVDRVVVGSPDVPEPKIVYQSPPVGARAVVGVEFRLR